jgi:hypothetical protein
MSMHGPSRIRRVLVVLIGATIAGVFAGPRADAGQSNFSAPCNITTSERVVAVGDVHGAYDRFVGILRTAQLVDDQARWTGGRAILVQTGDVLDRGADSRRVLDLLRRLERDAERAGGRVYALLGNHELMRLFSLWQYVSREELAAFRTDNSEDIRQQLYLRVATETGRRLREEQRPFDQAAFRAQFMRDIPLGFIEMRHAFSAGGDYGKWLRQRQALVRINGVLFVHGGVDIANAVVGCERMNAMIKKDLSVTDPTQEQAVALGSMSESGPLWYRGLAQLPDPAFAPEVSFVLDALDARAVVVGHTPAPAITARFGTRVIQIDTGMLGGEWYPGGVASALEIRGDTLTAIYDDRRESLPPLARID